jgi:single-stranded-DNA-specific exonuclease
VRRHALSPVLARLLVARGLDEPEAAGRHLAPNRTQLADPFALSGMRAATERVRRALEAQETILVHGDYDVDGVTGTALLVRLLRLVGARVEWHVPDRRVDGYSFGPHSVERARATGATLVISVDNGTSAGETIDELARLGVDVVVTDHHEPPLGPLPRAAAIVNPKLAGEHGFRELCGGAVAFKLAWGVALALSGEGRATPRLREFLEDALALVGLATVCDVVPLVDENRVFAGYGLKALATTRHAGLRALLERAGVLREGVPSAEDVAFRVGPRLNAAGRIGSAADAIELLLCEDEARARALAEVLERRNAERKEIERALCAEAFREAERLAARDELAPLVLAGQGWHQGVVGIVAARVVERFGRPALVIGLQGERGRGSARSLPGLDLLELMHGAAGCFERYGGHAQAAGCEVRADAIERLREALAVRARALWAERPPEAPPAWYDEELELAAVDAALLRELARLAPFGERNEKPVFRTRDLRLAEPPRRVGASGEHLALRVRRGPHVLRAIGFGLGPRADALGPGRPLEVLHTPRWSSWSGERRIELELHDLALAEQAPAESD